MRRPTLGETQEVNMQHTRTRTPPKVLHVAPLSNTCTASEEGCAFIRENGRPVVKTVKLHPVPSLLDQLEQRYAAPRMDEVDVGERMDRT